jgi:hypothetical protein
MLKHVTVYVVSVLVAATNTVVCCAANQLLIFMSVRVQSAPDIVYIESIYCDMFRICIPFRHVFLTPV